MIRVSETVGIPFDYRDDPLWGKFIDRAQHYGDNVAVVCTHQPPGHLDLPNTDLTDRGFSDNPYLRLNYRNLVDAVNKCANALIQLGVRPGTPVISFQPNKIEYPLTLWATIKLGCTWVPISPRNLLNQQEVSHMIGTALSWKESHSAVVIAGDTDIANKFDQIGVEAQWTKILISDQKHAGWYNFSDLFRAAPVSIAQNPSLTHQLGPDETVILFTSGTTSLPKGVAHPGKSFAYWSEQRCVKSDHGPHDVIFNIAPNNHAMGMVWTMIGSLNAATLVFPGASFDPEVMMTTMLLEKCTYLPLVPTMVHALVAVKAQSGGQVPSLKSIMMGGTMVTPELVDKCFNELGAQNVENLWGMTEGCVTATNGNSVQEFMDGDQLAVGYAAPNSRARVCAPHSKDPLPIGMPGELHYSSPNLTQGYIKKASDDFYTDDDGCRWFVTGDQATIDERGRIFVTGRYKEMIIRGGENIAPAAIESVLGQVPEILQLDVQIVGAKDSIAGEVPVAVYRGNRDLEIAQKIQQIVLSKIGPAHVPDQALALADLGLDDYPRTMAGKVKKSALAVLVQEFRDKNVQVTSVEIQSSGQLASMVKKVWKRALGYDVDVNSPFVTFADSITIMKTRDMIAKETGRKLSLKDMAEADTIASQIRLLQSQIPADETDRPRKKQRTGPVTADDIILFQDKPSAYPKGKAFIETVLAKSGFTWNDVTDITPCYDVGSLDTKVGIMDKVSFTIASVTKSQDLQHVRGALRKTLANNPLFTSLIAWNDKAFQSELALHIIMRQTDDFLNGRIHDFGSVKSLADLQALAQEYPRRDEVTIPGPLFDACLVLVEETQTVAILTRLHHAIMDASCSLMFFEDLDKVLGGTNLVEHVDYKAWGDSYYSLRNSVDAQIATRWHVDRLRGISSHRKAFWINDWPQHAHDAPIRFQFDIPDIVKLRQTHSSISAPVIVKTAFALLCAQRSKHSHSLFTSQQACRDRFPYVPHSLITLLGEEKFSAADVAGPTIERVVNLVEYRAGETVLNLLQRMQSDQDDLTKYAAAPAYNILDCLDEHDRPMFLDTYLSVNFNWVPGLAVSAAAASATIDVDGDCNGNSSSNNTTTTTGSYDHMDVVASVVRPPFAFAVNAGLGGTHGHTVIIDFMGKVMSRREHVVVGKEMERITRWLCDETNWEKEISGCF